MAAHFPPYLRLRTTSHGEFFRGLRVKTRLSVDSGERFRLARSALSGSWCNARGYSRSCPEFQSGTKHDFGLAAVRKRPRRSQ
jgi:hypothetical protein